MMTVTFYLQEFLIGKHWQLLATNENNLSIIFVLLTSSWDMWNFFQVTVLYSLGGRDIATQCRRMLDKLMSPMLMLHFNFNGKGMKGKKAFVDLPQNCTVMQGSLLPAVVDINLQTNELNYLFVLSTSVSFQTQRGLKLGVSNVTQWHIASHFKRTNSWLYDRLLRLCHGVH